MKREIVSVSKYNKYGEDHFNVKYQSGKWFMYFGKAPKSVQAFIDTATKTYVEEDDFLYGKVTWYWHT